MSVAYDSRSGRTWVWIVSVSGRQLRTDEYLLSPKPSSSCSSSVTHLGRSDCISLWKDTINRSRHRTEMMKSPDKAHRVTSKDHFH